MAGPGAAFNPDHARATTASHSETVAGERQVAAKRSARARFCNRRGAEMNSAAANPSIGPNGSALERHFSPDELGAIWGLSADSVRRLFEREPGVLVIEHLKSRAKRRYRTLRIPESVVERVHRRMTIPLLCQPGEHILSGHEKE